MIVAVVGLAGSALSSAGQYAGSSLYLGFGVGGMERIARATRRTCGYFSSASSRSAPPVGRTAPRRPPGTRQDLHTARSRPAQRVRSPVVETRVTTQGPSGLPRERAESSAGCGVRRSPPPDRRVRVVVSSTLGELAEDRRAAKAPITRLHLTNQRPKAAAVRTFDR